MMNNIKQYLIPAWPAPNNIKSFVTLKSSGIGQYIKNTDNQKSIFNLDFSLLQKVVALPSEPIWLKQIHSSTVLKAETKNRYVEADASYTDEPYQGCGVLTADCIPIFFCNTAGTKVAAIHAGWRGIYGKIIENTFSKLNVDASELLVWLGPAIGPSKFEVMEDVYNAFISMNNSYESAFTQTDKTHWHTNIYQLAKLKLHALGIHPSLIYGGQFCTYSEHDRFYSYRREQHQPNSTRGRNVSLIWFE